MKTVEQGRLSATVAQQPVLIGKEAVEAASKVLKGKKVKSRVAVPLKLVE